MDKKLKAFLRNEMRKVNLRNYNPLGSTRSDYHKGFQQGVFDLLMDIDQKFQLGAFYKRRVRQAR